MGTGPAGGEGVFTTSGSVGGATVPVTIFFFAAAGKSAPFLSLPGADVAVNVSETVAATRNWRIVIMRSLPFAWKITIPKGIGQNEVADAGRFFPKPF